MAGVFINYRELDTSHLSARIYGRLVERLKGTEVFRARESLRPGESYPDGIRDALERVHVLIAVVGRHWLNLRDEHGDRLIDRDGDWVRDEIARALARGIKVIPVLDADAPVLTKRDLPPDIRELAIRQAVRVSDHQFDHDVEALIKAVREPLPVRRPRLTVLVTGMMLVVLVTVVTIVIVLSRQLSQQGSPPGPGASTVTSTGGGSVGAESTPPRTVETTSGQVGTQSVRSEGPLLLQGEGFDLDQFQRSEGGDFRLTLTEVDPGDGTTILTWPHDQAPSKVECAKQVDGAQPGVPVFEPPAAAWLCVRTHGGRIAVLQYGGVLPSGVFDVYALVWEK
jgi:hypothetical protein